MRLRADPYRSQITLGTGLARTEKEFRRRITNTHSSKTPLSQHATQRQQTLRTATGTITGGEEEEIVEGRGLWMKKKFGHVWAAKTRQPATLSHLFSSLLSASSSAALRTTPGRRGEKNPGRGEEKSPGREEEKSPRRPPSPSPPTGPPSPPPPAKHQDSLKGPAAGRGKPVARGLQPRSYQGNATHTKHHS